jgi:hypothetical protein
MEAIRRSLLQRSDIGEKMKKVSPNDCRVTIGPRNFLSVKVFRMDLEADFKRLFVVGFGC